jgi:hypothetical protein
MFYKAVKLGLVNPATSVQVGIRTENPEPMGFHIIDAPEVHETGPRAVVEKIRRILGDNVYVSFDIDVLDPAFAPGTGTPVWGGLASWQAAAILRGLKGLPILGGRCGGGLSALRYHGRDRDRRGARGDGDPRALVFVAQEMSDPGASGRRMDGVWKTYG